MAEQTAVAVVIASAGRPEMLADVVARCDTGPAALHGVVSVPDEKSLPVDAQALGEWRVVTGVQGCSAQRNAGLDILDASVKSVLG